jgi:hypothetical protein
MSNVKQLDMTWRPKLLEVKAMLADHLRDKSKPGQIVSATHCWQGHAFQACITVASCKRDGTGDEYHTSFGLYMGLPSLADGATCSAVVKQVMLDTRTSTYTVEGPVTFVGTQPCGFLGTPQLGSVSNAAEAEDRLRELGLVQSDGCLVVKSMVSHVW